MIRYWLACILTLAAPVYGKSSIPDWVAQELAKNYQPKSPETDAIFLLSETNVGIEKRTLTTEEKELIRIVKTGGSEYALLRIDTVVGSRISDFHAWRINRSGELLENLGKKDLLRRGDNISFHDDSEQVYAEFKNVEPGDAVAFEYVHTRDLSSSDLFFTLGSPIEIARMIVRTPAQSKCAILNDPQNRIRREGNAFILENQPARINEIYAPPFAATVPRLAIVIDSESRASWEAFSRKYFSESNQPNGLNEKSKSDLQYLLSISNKVEFIKSALQYVSMNIQYIDVEYGEGRFIPRDCNFVHEKKYGDCKDAAFYTAAILRANNFTALPALAAMRRIGRVDEGCPSMQFNHMVVAILLDAETADLQNIKIDGQPYLIVDPTDRYTSIPSIGRHIENASILPISESGAPLVRLPASPSTQNVIKSELTMHCNKNRSLETALIETRTGHFAAEEMHLRVASDASKERDDMTRRTQRIVPGASLKDYSLEASSNRTVTRISFTVNDAVSESAGKSFIIPNLIDLRRSGFTDRTRQSDIDLGFLFEEIIHIAISFEDGISITSIPENAELDNEFFSCSYQVEGDQRGVQIRKHFKWKTSVIKVADYSKFRKYYQEYLKAMKSGIFFE